MSKIEKSKDKVLFYYHYSYGEVSTEKQDKFIKPNIPYNNKEYIYRIRDWIVEYHYFNGLEHCYSQGLTAIESVSPPLTLMRGYLSFNIKNCKGYYFLDRNLNKQGKCLEYYQNKTLILSYFYKDGRREGEYIQYNEDGNVFRHSFYKRDLIEGEDIRYFGNGANNIHRFYKAGKLQSKYVDCYGEIINIK